VLNAYLINELKQDWFSVSTKKTCMCGEGEVEEERKERKTRRERERD
jgi:hypothetical protein